MVKLNLLSHCLEAAGFEEKVQQTKELDHECDGEKINEKIDNPDDTNLFK